MDKKYIIEIYTNIRNLIFALQGCSIGFLIGATMEMSRRDNCFNKKEKVIIVIGIVVAILSTIFVTFAPTPRLLTEMIK